jgi:hypothetical protein
MYVLAMMTGFARQFLAGGDRMAIQQNNKPSNSATFFVSCIYTLSPEEKTLLSHQLILLPALTLASGLIGLGFLYGWKCENREDSANEIAWDSIKVQRKMNAIKDLKINDMIDLLEAKKEDFDEEYSMKTETFSADVSMLEISRAEHSKRLIDKAERRRRASDVGLLASNLENFEGDDAIKLIEAQLGGKAINMNIDKERGQIIITFRGSVRKTTLINVLLCRQMIYLYISFSCSGTIVMFYISKLARTPLMYLYTEDYNGPAIVAQAMYAAIFMFSNILLLQRHRSKKFMLANYSILTFCLILVYSTLSESLVGVMLTCTCCLFTFVYMKVMILFIVAVSARKSKLFIYLYPAFYAVFIISNLLKVLVVDRYDDDFRSLVLVFLLIQAAGFMFMNGFDLEILQNKCFEYGAYQEKMEQKKGK